MEEDNLVAVEGIGYLTPIQLTSLNTDLSQGKPISLL